MRTINLSPGPAMLPKAVLDRFYGPESRNFRGTGISIAELSHRHPAYEALNAEVEANLRRLLDVPNEFAVLLLQGGATTQFNTLPKLLLRDGGVGQYIITGRWSEKAFEEVEQHKRNPLASGKEGDFRRLPDLGMVSVPGDSRYVHVTWNNTVYGTEWVELPRIGEIPLVVDASSNIATRPIPWDLCVAVYACAQKNIGGAGVTVVFVRKDAVTGKIPGLSPALDYYTQTGKASNYNTPPVVSVFLMHLMVEWLLDNGGIAGARERSDIKAAKVYGVLDALDLYQPLAERGSRSTMNITFTLSKPDQEEALIAAATKGNFAGFLGHRSTGGFRASLYNGMEMDDAEDFANFLQRFAQMHG